MTEPAVAAPGLADRMVCCDECRQGFAQRANSFIEREGDVETVGLQCPHCGARFVAYRTTPKIRRLQAELREVQEKFNQVVVAGGAVRKAKREVDRVARKLEAAVIAAN